jgi:hypothetical protein
VTSVGSRGGWGDVAAGARVRVRVRARATSVETLGVAGRLGLGLRGGRVPLPI